MDLALDIHTTPDGKTYLAYFGSVACVYKDFIVYQDLSFYIDWIKNNIRL